jgi:hypothetical protein
VNNIGQNLQRIKERIAAAAASCGRSPDEITLLAISKTFPVDVISEAIDAGLRQFGENRVQEAESKILHFREILELEWHLVGHLQSNKAKRAAELFDVVHSVDSIKVATKLSQTCQELEKVISVLLQVDLGGEPTKSGAEAGRVKEIVEAVSNLKGIQLDGLMTIPPFSEDPGQSQPFYARLRELREMLESERPGCLGRKRLSMGMSHDFEVAIKEGATIIRIGTAIFGSRQ